MSWQMDLAQLDGVALSRALALGDVTPGDVATSLSGHVDRIEPQVGAFLRLDLEGLEERIAAARNLAPFHGLPVAIKDNIVDEAGPTTCASKMLAGYRSPFEATVLERLRRAGAVVVAKANLDEFAMGSSTETSAFGPTRNPFDLTRVPGGSSGGSAAAVAAGMVPVALGSDTGGSVRQPAALCGVVGLKPTYGRVSRYGLVAFGSSLDQIGPLARSVRDVARVLQVVAGHDPRDATSSSRPVDRYEEALDGPWTDDLGGLRVGLPEEFLGGGLAPEIADRLGEVAAALEDLGAEVRPVSLPRLRNAVGIYYIIATAEASSNLARFDGIRYGHRSGAPEAARELAACVRLSRQEGFGREVKRRIILGTFVLSSGYYEAYYGRAQRVRGGLQREALELLTEVDLLLGPTTPTTAFRLGERLDDPLTMYLSDVYTVTANLTGLPALSLPVGVDTRGLPIGAQFMGRPFEEGLLLRVAGALERHAFPPLTPRVPEGPAP